MVSEYKLAVYFSKTVYNISLIRYRKSTIRIVQYLFHIKLAKRFPHLLVHIIRRSRPSLMINRTVYWNTLESTQNIVATSPAVLFAAAAQNHHPGSPELSGPAPPWAACGTLAFPSAVLLPRLGTVSFYSYHIIKLWFLHCTYSIQG